MTRAEPKGGQKAATAAKMAAAILAVDSETKRKRRLRSPAKPEVMAAVARVMSGATQG